jgi:hypothetical protein
MRLRAIVLGLLLVGCSVSGPAMPSESAETTAETPARTVIATGTSTPAATATRTPRPTRTPTTVPSVTPTLDPATLPVMRIAFVRSENMMWMGEADIWVINADGSDERLLIHYRPDSMLGAEFAFSPDGCWLAVTDASQGLLVDVRTGERTVIDETDFGTNQQVTNYAWSQDSTTLTYYRGTSPDRTGAIPELRQTRRLPDGAWSEPETFPLASGRVMLPVWELADGRILTQMFGAGRGFSGVSYITDITTGFTQTLTFPGFDDHSLYVSDATLDGRIVFREDHWVAAEVDPNSYVGRITASGAITDAVILTPPPGGSIVYAGKFTPDETGVLAITQHGLHGGRKEYGLFSLLNDGTTRYTSLLADQPFIAGDSPLGLDYAIVSVSDDMMMETGVLWLLALDGSVKAALTEGFWPVGLPVCEE